MSLFTFITDTKDLLPVLKRIADALDRIAPLPEADAPELKPEEAVAYVDEDAMARREELDALGADASRLRQWIDEHPEEAAEMGLTI